MYHLRAAAVLAALCGCAGAAGLMVSDDPLQHASDFAGSSTIPIGAHKPAAEDLARYVRYGLSAVPAHVDFSAHPASGEYDFSALEADLDGYARHGLRFEVHLHTNGAPAWFREEHGEAMWMQDQWGSALRHWSGTSYHYAPYLDLVRRFDAEVARLVTGRPEWDGLLYGWDLRNEPAYPRPIDAGLEPGVRWFDHSPPAEEAFTSYLASRYGDPAALGDAWGVACESFDDVSAPTDDSNVAAWVDWLAFREEALARFLAEAAGAVMEVDSKRRPVAAKIMAGAWHLDEAAVDGAGFDSSARWTARGALGADLYAADPAAVCAVVDKMRCTGLPPWLTEFGTGLAPSQAEAGRLHRCLWTAAGRGARCIFLFTWGRWPEFASHGLCDGDGRPTLRIPYVSLFAHGLHRAGRYLARPSVPARLAVFDPRVDTLLMYPADRPMDWGAGPNPFTEVHRLLRRLHYEVDFVTAEDVRAGKLADYEVLFLVNARHLDGDVCRAVSDFAAGGGDLVADAMTAAWDAHGRRAEGPPLHELLGVTHVGWSGEGEAALAITSPKLGEDIVGREAPVIRRELIDAESPYSVVGRFSDGRPSVVYTRRRYSYRLYVASDLGALASADPRTWADLLGGFLDEARHRPDVQTIRGKTFDLDISVRTDGQGNTAVVLVNAGEGEPGPVTVRVADPATADLYRGYLLPADSMEVSRIGTTRILRRVGFAIDRLGPGAMVLILANAPPLLGASVAPGPEEGEPVPAVPPGADLVVTATVDNPSSDHIAACSLLLRAPVGWAADAWASPEESLRSGERLTHAFAVRAPTQVPDDYYPLVLRARYDGRVSDPCTVMVRVRGAD